MGAKNFNFQKGLEEGDLSLDALDASGMNEATSIKLNFDEEEEPIELLEEEVVDDDDGVDIAMDFPMKIEEASSELESHTAEEAALVSGMGKELLLNIQHNLSVELGRVRMSGIEIMELTYGCVVELEKIAGDPVDLVMNGKVVAFGEIVLINNEKLGIRIIGINQN